MPVINGVYTKDFPALGRAPIDTDIIPIAEVANQITFKTTIGEIFNAKVFGTAGAIPKFTSGNTLGDSIITELSDKIGIDIATPNNKLSINSTDPGSGLDLQIGATSYARFGIINPGLPGEPGIDNDCFIGSTINNDFLVRTNNIEALRIDTAQRLTIANIQNALADTDKFLVSEGGVVKYRTGAEVLADIGAGVGSVTSVGLTMPVAFSVANSPITSAGTLEVTAIGTASQYIRGDGTLATIPSTSSGGANVNYYLNGSVAASVATYKQMDNSAVIGAGTDFNLTGNGLIAQFLTDAGNPNRLLIPGGAWNFEMYFNISSSGGNSKFYVELLKYDGTTFTSIASSSAVPEEITGGTTTDLYITSLAVPETTLLITDRLALRVYIVNNSGGRTVTLHTEDNTLCLVTTTFAGGIAALNGLTANTQYFATGTTGSDFNISSVLDTHTFNIPSASATARGLITTGTQTIAGAKTFSSDLTVNGVNIGLGGGAIRSNTRVGNLALNANTTGANNIAIGLQALYRNTSGVQNTAIGVYSLTYNTTGNNNTATGINTLQSNISGYENTANGADALYRNTTGFKNVAYGAYSLYNNTIGFNNVANGVSALFGNTTGVNNVASGLNSGDANTTGSNNIFLGYNSDGESATESNRTWIGNADTTSTWLGGNLLLGSRTNATSDKLQITGGAKITGIITLGTGADSYVYDSGGSLILQTGASARLTINSAGNTTLSGTLNGTSATFSGNVFVGGATGVFPTTGRGLLEVNGTTNALLGLTIGSSAKAYFYHDGTNLGIKTYTGNITFDNATSTAMTLTAGGNLLINGVSDFGSGSKLIVTGTITGGSSTWNNSNTGGAIQMFSDNANYGTIWALKNGNQAWGNIVIAPLGGNVLIGTTTDAGYKLDVNGTGRFSSDLTLSSTGNAFIVLNNTTPSTGRQWRFSSAANGTLFITQVGVIDVVQIAPTTGATTLSNLAGTGSRAVLADANGLLSAPVSDISVKENIKPIGYGLNEIVKMNPVWFDFVDDYKNFGEGRQNGNIAQEMQKIIPFRFLYATLLHYCAKPEHLQKRS